MMNNEKYKKILDVAKESLHNAAWLWVSKDGSDRLFDLYLTNRYSSTTYAIVNAESIKFVVSTLDADIDFETMKVPYTKISHVPGTIASCFSKKPWPRTIFLNYSESADPKVDSLGHGMFTSTTAMIEKIYEDNQQPKPNFESSEDLLYSLIERRSPQQIERMQLAAKRANAILKSSFSKIKLGMSEKEIFALVQSTYLETQKEFCETNNVESETFSWAEGMCPIILVGPNLVKGGHAEPSDYRIKEGETVYADFGVKLYFADGGAVSSDLQRMAYLLKSDETTAPEGVQKVFDTLRKSVKTGIENIRPGMLGYEVDEIVRSHIVDAGYPNYDHSTGHPIGEVAHGPGTLLAPKDNKRSNRKVQLNGTYTIEPRCQVPNGGSIEEMVLVTEQGGVTLCEQQTELWLIPSND